MTVVIQPLDDDSIRVMAEKMRPMDRFEFDVQTFGGDVVEELTKMCDRGNALAGYVDGELVCIYGVCKGTTLTKSGTPWLLATDEVEKPHVRRVFLERGHDELASIGRRFRRLWNVVSEDNRIAIRWLKWLGFTFDGTEYWLQDHRFLRFEMENSHVF